jgi:hypothetical protein
MSLLQNSNAISAGGYDINNSLRFRSSASAYLARTPLTAGNRQIMTYSVWVKRGAITGDYNITNATTDANNSATLYFNSSNSQSFDVFLRVSATNYTVRTTQVFRDPSAWYHIVVAIDTTQATSSNRTKIYVNGSEVTALTASYVPQNSNLAFNNNVAQYIGFTNYFDGYMAEFNFIDGQALTPSSFGETDPVTGSWVAKKYTGTYGTNGFYLPFSDTDSNENRFLYSEDFANASWTKGAATVTSNTVVAPDGTTTADTLTDNATSDQHLIVQGTAAPSVGSQYTMSIYAKANTRSQIGLTMHGESYAAFDLSAGTVISTGGYSNVGITSVGNGWYRCYVTITKTNADGGIYYIIYKDGVNPYLGTGTGSIYIWGAQVTYGSILQPYIKTTTAAITNQGTIENLLTYSEDLTNAAWDKSGNVTATGNTLVAPNGATTADTLFETAVNNEHYLQRTLTPVTNTQYVFSTYVKYLNRKYIALRIVYSNGAQDTLTIFDIQNGTYYGYDGSAPTATSITSVGNGWYRISATFTTPATNPTSSLLFRHQFRDDSLVGNYAGNASVGMYLWGAQIETQGTLGPYLPTVASAQSLVNRIGTDRSLGATGFGYNTWIPNNISLTLGTTYDAMTDSPTLTSETVANYATLNPLKFLGTLSNANLNLTATSASWQNASSTLFVNSGKWYFEATVITRAATFGCMIGIGTPDSNISTSYSSGDTFTYLSDGGKYGGGSYGGGYGVSFTAGDIIGVAFDCDARTITFYKNNVSQGTAFSNLVAGSFYGAWLGVHTSASSIALNCGQRPFSYTPPTGFKRLNTFNLPDSTIKKGNKYMDATTYTGNGSTQTITNAGAFKPDFLWIKTRSAISDHFAFNSVAGSNKYLIPNSPGAETTAALITSFNSNGFSLSSDNGVNLNSATFIGWQWQAGQGTNTTNTAGSITSTVSVNTTAGFSIVTYTGTGANATVGHGLGVAPRFIIIKKRNDVVSSTVDWRGYHASLGSTAAFGLNLTTTPDTNAAYFNNTNPTPSVFTLGNGLAVNISAGTYVAYCWAEIAGFSKFGSYTGNGSTDGPFVYTGFRPKFVLIKNTSSTYSWWLVDTARNPINLAQNTLAPNSSAAESANEGIDILSNGFKARANGQNTNNNGSNYIYAAFAENPFKNANAR